MRFQNRQHAGRLLAAALSPYKDSDSVVYALPRGGVVLGAEIAKNLHLPLDIVTPRKISHQHHPEYAICAITEDGHLVCNEEEIVRADPKWLREAIQQELREAQRRRTFYTSHRDPIPVEDKVAIITDDGIATGLTMLAAIQEVRSRNPAKIVLAVPVIPSDVAELLGDYVEDVEALEISEVFAGAVGAYYDDFTQVTDEEVMQLLDSAQTRTTKDKGGA